MALGQPDLVLTVHNSLDKQHPLVSIKNDTAGSLISYHLFGHREIFLSVAAGYVQAADYRSQVYHSAEWTPEMQWLGRRGDAQIIASAEVAVLPIARGVW